MKQIEAIIQTFKADEVIAALTRVPGVGGVTAVDVRGFGVQRGKNGMERPAFGSFSFVPKVMLILVVSDDAVEAVIEAIRKHAQTGNFGDGKVFVLPIEDALRVRTGERGEEAL